ncbi:armadillo-type protein [Penicillium malachiteum]|nr:armadillo-type protein [Penicillium malachiteum]
MLEQADKVLQEEYYTDERLKIYRLSGQPLPIDSCYINLAIIKKIDYTINHGSQDQKPSRHSLFARQKVETPDGMPQVDLSAIFDPFKTQDPDNPEKQVTIEPRRILIRGRAGIGKTTLCKKIIHDFTRGRDTDLHRSWTKLFDRVLWIPLRNLRNSSVRSYEELFYDEYFQKLRKEAIAPSLAAALSYEFDTTEGRRTLFLLDGLDELAIDSELLKGQSEFLEKLMKNPNVIITSRPNARIPETIKPLDLELETIGFFPHQVAAYIEALKVQNGEGQHAEDAQSFLQSNWLLKGLFQIPILLDAFCYIWQDEKIEASDTTASIYRQYIWEDGTTHVPDTMTSVYCEIELKLWRKDTSRVRKKRTIDFRNRPGVIFNHFHHEIQFLEHLAFSGLHSDVIDFTPKQRDRIGGLWSKDSSELPTDDELVDLSFLRTSDPSRDPVHTNYHFIHLTFQEYFAAKYFVRRWMDGGQLVFALEGSTNPEGYSSTDPEKFLAQHKYQERFDLFWRFVAGLLWRQDKQQLLRFFKQINAEPRDLLGLAHQRVLMHCFHEVPHSESESSLEDLRKQMERRCEEWTIYEYKRLKYTLLCREPEFPDEILCKMLTEVSDDERVAILQSLFYRSHLAFNVLDAIGDFLNFNGNEDVRLSAVEALAKQPSLSESILQALVLRLEDSNKHVRRSAVKALAKQPSLSESILRALVLRLEDCNKHVRRSAVKALAKQPSLSESILQAIVSRVEDSKGYIGWSVVMTLAKQPSLSESILQALVLRLEDSNWLVRASAVKALAERPSLSESILQALVLRLEDSEEEVRLSAVEALAKQPSLSESILQALVSQLESGDWSVRHLVVEALAKQPSLSENILQALVSQLESGDWSVRHLVVEALAKQPSLSESILQALVLRLEDSNEDVRLLAVEALAEQPSLSESILQALVLRLEDSNEDVRLLAVEALAEQPSLSESILQALVLRLEDSKEYVRQSAAGAINNDFLYSVLPTLPTHTLQTLYRSWLDKCITDHFSCYVHDGILYIDIPHDRRAIPLHGTHNVGIAFMGEAFSRGVPGS